ncbi:3D (Asp-Asp-Asp) domain-containing protein [Paenibacillus sp. 1_12]|uniref:stalk domain-containing protein n=1 Tax=Paenibacillus sp. 1_12 TaxID=1566278 RepID=UPI0008F3AAEE|nr:3D domain-containing protein [Paenibacillus sp. 1_12]SFM58127.1 3D (Asp-Asp-Asp) domain-containing protein [Paenibacillus sp. 1_12]
MRRFTKLFILSSIVLFSFFASVSSIHAAPPPLVNDVKVQVNEQLITFPDAQPFLDSNHLLQIPVRIIGQKLNYEINWKTIGQSLNITLTKEDHIFSFTTGISNATTNGDSLLLESIPQLINGIAYVPLRDLANALGIRIQWDAQNRIAILNQDGKYHAPSWYAPNYKIIDGTATAYTGSSAENGGYAGKDYFGNPLAVGSISVDPSIIPLGSKVYIEGYDYEGLPSGGLFATALDTGNAIKGNKIDIYVPDNQKKAAQFGIQQVKIYFLNN